MNSTLTREPQTSPSAIAFPLRPRPTTGLGANWIGAEEEALVLDVVRRREPNRYCSTDARNPPPMAATLEREFAQMLDVPYTLAVTSGSAALEVALGALGVGPGDEVIINAWSWISCFTSIVRLGALPVLAEIDGSFNIAPGEITRLSNERTKAVSVVHFQGSPAAMEPILAEAKAAGIKIIEDCAQSCGAMYKGQRVGTFGDIGTFSFQYQKTITSGEGGLVAMRDPELYERAVRMHDLGIMRAYHADIVKPRGPSFSGGQFRMGEMQAAMAIAQLRKLDKIRNHCRALRDRILSQISDLKKLDLRDVADPDGESGFEIYLNLPDPLVADEFRSRLDALNVNCQKMTGTYCHYAREYCEKGLAYTPTASPFAHFERWPAPGYRAQDFPRTEALIHRFVALPLGTLYTMEDTDYIAACVRRVYGEVLG